VEVLIVATQQGLAYNESIVFKVVSSALMGGFITRMA